MGDNLLAGELIELRQGVRLQVCYASGNPPALVFLHGGLGNRFNWRSQYEFVLAQGWEAIAYDLAGHGQSAPYSRFSIGRHRRDLTRLLHRYQIQAPVLCCHSYGVPIGLEWAQRHPVKAMILIGGGTHDLDPWWEIPLMKFMAFGGRYLYHLPFMQQVSRAISSSHSHLTIEQFFGESPMPIERYSYEALEIFWGYNFFARRKSDRYLNIPMLVISGGQDAMFSRQMGETLASRFNHNQHLHLPTAGHLVMAEYPTVVNEAIADWLEQWLD